VIVRFDGKEVKDSRDLPRIVASTPVGKAVDVAIVRKGQEMTRQVTLGRLETPRSRQASSSLPPSRRRQPARLLASTCLA
jgi:serine protease Do